MAAALSQFASDLLEEAKHFLEKSDEAATTTGKQAYLHAAILVGFASFEAHINEICSEFLSLAGITPHERGLLGENVVELIDGGFQVKTNALKVQRLEDRILFLCRRFSVKPVDRKAQYWGNFLEAVRLRNTVTHPKPGLSKLTPDETRRALKALIEMLNVICLRVYKKKFPAHSRGLSSKLTF